MIPTIEQGQTPGRSTLVAVSAVSFIVACVAHEAIGHGGMCLAVGGRIRLLTSVYFSGTNGGALTDAAGPLMNLVAGAVCWALARGRRRGGTGGRAGRLRVGTWLPLGWCGHVASHGKRARAGGCECDRRPGHGHAHLVDHLNGERASILSGRTADIAPDHVCVGVQTSPVMPIQGDAGHDAPGGGKRQETRILSRRRHGPADGHTIICFLLERPVRPGPPSRRYRFPNAFHSCAVDLRRAAQCAHSFPLRSPQTADLRRTRG